MQNVPPPLVMVNGPWKLITDVPVNLWLVIISYQSITFCNVFSSFVEYFLAFFKPLNRWSGNTCNQGKRQYWDTFQFRNPFHERFCWQTTVFKNSNIKLPSKIVKIKHPLVFSFLPSTTTCRVYEDPFSAPPSLVGWTILAGVRHPTLAWWVFSHKEVCTTPL